MAAMHKPKAQARLTAFGPSSARLSLTADDRYAPDLPLASGPPLSALCRLPIRRRIVRSMVWRQTAA